MGQSNCSISTNLNVNYSNWYSSSNIGFPAAQWMQVGDGCSSGLDTAWITFITYEGYFFLIFIDNKADTIQRTWKGLRDESSSHLSFHFSGIKLQQAGASFLFVLFSVICLNESSENAFLFHMVHSKENICVMLDEWQYFTQCLHQYHQLRENLFALSITELSLGYSGHSGTYPPSLGKASFISLPASSD